VRPEQPVEVSQREPGDALHVLRRRRGSPIVYDNALDEETGVNRA
jgi:hypothetical protein